MKYFAILHKPTGSFLPLNRGRSRGFTYVTPNGDRPPRLFTKRSAAKIALDWWLGGPVITRWHEDEGAEIVGQKADPGRRADEMEVVAISLEVTA